MQGDDTTGKIDITRILIPCETKTLRLENKDSLWSIIEETGQTTPIYADVTYNTCSNLFECTIAYSGLSGNTDYSLIYYGDDATDRSTNWGKTVHVIETWKTESDGIGTVTPSTSIDLETNLPYYTDWNTGLYASALNIGRSADVSGKADYSIAPTAGDGYTHKWGAKLWIVPSEMLIDSTPNAKTTMKSYDATKILFETDLIVYLDCNMEPEKYCKVYELYGDNEQPYTLAPLTTYCLLTCYKIENTFASIYFYAYLIPHVVL
jgi:hypothetical protein